MEEKHSPARADPKRQLSSGEIEVLHALVAARRIDVAALRRCLNEVQDRGAGSLVEILEREGVDRAEIERRPEAARFATERIRIEDTEVFEPLVPAGFRALRMWDRSAELVLVEERRGGRRGVLRLYPTPPVEAEGALGRFEEALRAVSSIDHPGIPRILAHGTVEKSLYSVREEFEGRNLAEILEVPPPPQRWVRIVLEAAVALDQLHQRGMAHGDLRPKNVHSPPDGSVVLAEMTFGFHPASLSPRLVSGFWSPRCLQSREAVPVPGDDVFSLGALLYRGLTGRMPYEGEDREEILRSLVEKTPAPVRQCLPSADRMTEAICQRALEIDARLRFQDAGEFARELSRDAVGEVSHRGADRPLPRPGQRLSHFTIRRRLGEGGMGIIYLARHEGLARDVALKILKATGTVEHQRFLREARILASLEHPGILRILDVDEADGCAYIAVEYLGGGSLESRLARETRLSARETLDVMVPIASALAHAHSKGVLHRDIKPDNILFDENGTPKLGDFGLAKGGGLAHSLTSTGVVIGTPFYLSPEAARGERDLTPACDVYSFGAVLYRCLTGTLPHGSNRLSDLLKEIQDVDPAPPRGLCAEIPRALEKVVLTALSREPAKRYPDGRALHEALERIRGGSSSRAIAGGRLGRLGRLGIVLALLVGALLVWLVTRFAPW